MEDRRRSNRSRQLNNVPQTEVELLWEEREMLAVINERLDNHLNEHAKIDAKAASSASIRWMQVGVALTFIASIISIFHPHG